MNEPSSHIRYLTRKEIDIVKWDRCISHSGNGLIYGLSFYLDAMSENWCALVEADYTRVMPLTWNKKYGFPYLYQPYFTKALGVFGNVSLPFDITPFLLAIPEKYKFWDLDLNEHNFISANPDPLRWKQVERTNYLLDLSADYAKVRHEYKRLANRMISKANACDLQVIKGENPSLIIRLFLKDYRHKLSRIHPRIYKKLTGAAQIAFENKQADTYLAITPAGNPVAYYLILTDKRFVYSLLGGSTSEGKKKGAFFFLTDSVIRDYSGTGKIFRFEGSDIPGISFFNALFGPEPVNYQHIKMNNLPFPFRLLK